MSPDFELVHTKRTLASSREALRSYCLEAPSPVPSSRRPVLPGDRWEGCLDIKLKILPFVLACKCKNIMSLDAPHWFKGVSSEPDLKSSFDVTIRFSPVEVQGAYSLLVGGYL